MIVKCEYYSYIRKNLCCECELRVLLIFANIRIRPTPKNQNTIFLKFFIKKTKKKKKKKKKKLNKSINDRKNDQRMKEIPNSKEASSL